MEHDDRKTTGIWVLLMAATIVTTWVLSKDNVSAQLATAFTIVIAAWKVRLVLLHFMELKHAPMVPRMLFEMWVVLASGVILVPYSMIPTT